MGRVLHVPTEPTPQARARCAALLQDPRWRAQRAALAPLLRKYLLHPDASVRSAAIRALQLLGCLKERPGSNVELTTALAQDADKVRMVAAHSAGLDCCQYTQLP